MSEYDDVNRELKRLANARKRLHSEATYDPSAIRLGTLMHAWMTFTRDALVLALLAELVVLAGKELIR